MAIHHILYLVSFGVLCQHGVLSNDTSYEWVYMYCHGWMKFGWILCQLVKQSLVCFASSQSCNENLSWWVKSSWKNHLISDSNCNIIVGY